MRQWLIPSILIAFTMPNANALDFGVGPGSACSEVSDSITAQWFQLKQVMLPPGVNLVRPQDRDLFCVSPYYTTSAIVRSAGGSNLACYQIQPDTPVFCCTSGLSQCAQIHPDAISRQMARQAKQEKKRLAQEEKQRLKEERKRQKDAPARD